MQPKEYIIKLLEGTIKMIKADTSTIDAQTAMSIAEMVAHIPMSKEQACTYLNMSRSKFDQYVSEGKLPKGKKRVGHNELDWFKDELDRCLYFPEV
jgi:predicted DNA-binding transcriptional regulator AlpA